MSAGKSNGAEPKLSATVEVVTPEKALAWLENAARNRGISDQAVRRYGADMETGRWTLNGQGIVFSAEGKLLDGRHRLTAIVATRCEVPMLIVRGARDDAFETMDSGRSRTLANTLSIEGKKNTGAVAAAARITWAYAAGTNLKYGATRIELLNLIRAHPMIEDYSTQIANRDHLTRPLGLPRPGFTALLALANDSRKHDAMVSEFIEGFITGEGLFHGDPRLTLRRWLAKQRADTGLGGARISEPFFAAACRAWSAFATQRDLPMIRLPMFFNRETLHIEGFDPAQFGDVPDLSRFSFAALGPEPLSGRDGDRPGLVAAGPTRSRAGTTANCR